MASTTNRVMKPSEWEQLGLHSAAKKRSRRSGNSRGGLDVREILPHPADGEECLIDIPFYRTSHNETSGPRRRAVVNKSTHDLSRTGRSAGITYDI